MQKQLANVELQAIENKKHLMVREGKLRSAMATSTICQVSYNQNIEVLNSTYTGSYEEGQGSYADERIHESHRKCK